MGFVWRHFSPRFFQPSHNRQDPGMAVLQWPLCDHAVRQTLFATACETCVARGANVCRADKCKRWLVGSSSILISEVGDPCGDKGFSRESWRCKSFKPKRGMHLGTVFRKSKQSPDFLVYRWHTSIGRVAPGSPSCNSYISILLSFYLFYILVFLPQACFVPIS